MLSPNIRAVVPLPPTRLRLEYIDGQVRVFDIEPLLGTGLYRDLKDPSMFASARPDLDTVAWANGIDVDPERLYEDSVPVGSDHSA